MLCFESKTDSAPIRFGASLVTALCSPHGKGRGKGATNRARAAEYLMANQQRPAGQPALLLIHARYNDVNGPEAAHAHLYFQGLEGLL